jgi:hypothetical protein
VGGQVIRVGRGLDRINPLDAGPLGAALAQMAGRRRSSCAGRSGRGGISTATAEVTLADAIARPWNYERDPRGTLGLLADRDRRVLAGAWAVAPLASEWIHQASLAIRAQIPISILLDQVAQFPTYTEAYLAALEQLRP